MKLSCNDQRVLLTSIYPVCSLEVFQNATVRTNCFIGTLCDPQVLAVRQFCTSSHTSRNIASFESSLLTTTGQGASFD